MFIIRFIGKIFYKIIAIRLPSSVSKIKIGQRIIRVFLAKMMGVKVGKKVNIEKGANFTNQLIIGDYSGIGINCKLYGKITIGKYCLMAPDVIMITSNHKFERTDIPIKNQGVTDQKPITIEDDVWIGERVIILPGVTLHSGCIVGAGSVVTKDVPAYTIVAGNPATIRKRREKIEKNSNINNVL